MEKVQGSFGARMFKMWSGDVQYQIYVSDERAVAVRTGGQFSGQSGQLLAHQLGLLGLLIHKLFLEKREARKKAEQLKSFEQSTLDELLARHPKNFALPLHALKRARIERKRFSSHGPVVAKLTLEPQQGKPIQLFLQSAQDLDQCRALLGQALEGRITLDPKLPAPRPKA